MQVRFTVPSTHLLSNASRLDRQLVGEMLHFIVCPVLYHGSSKKLGALLRRQVWLKPSRSSFNTNHRFRRVDLQFLDGFNPERESQ